MPSAPRHCRPGYPETLHHNSLISGERIIPGAAAELDAVVGKHGANGLGFGDDMVCFGVQFGGMSRSLLKFAERTLLFKSYAASAI
jgi:hypothetical protein